jgi:shikimate kinase
MKWTKEKFLSQNTKTVALMGMSGVGKTYLADILSSANWRHHSIDYEIATKYLEKHILDNIRSIAYSDPLLKDLIKSGPIDIKNIVSVDNLSIVSKYLGMVGNPEKGGLSIEEFRSRQARYMDAEITAIANISELTESNRKSANPRSIVIDTTGSLCEVTDDNLIKKLSEQSVIIYIKATEADEKELLRRAMSNPKPLFYPEPFFTRTLDLFMEEHSIKAPEAIDPVEFYVFAFPKLFYHRLPKYEQIARKYGYTISRESFAGIRSEEEFINAIAQAIKGDCTGY